MENSRTNLAQDGCVEKGQVCFYPVGKQDEAKAFDDNCVPVVLGIDEESYACFDVFNTDGSEFCGHLDMFFDRGGYLSFSDLRKTPEGKYEVRTSYLTAGKLFGSGTNFPKSRSELSHAMMEVAKTIHEMNASSGGWEPVQNSVIRQRCSGTNEGKICL